jgi:methionyl aminopeptidase
LAKPNITFNSEKDIDGLRASGQIVAKVLLEMINKLKPGVTTAYLDEIAGKNLKLLSANSAPKLEGFPGNTCISVNEIIAHGVPSKRTLRCGDRVNIDVSAEHNGYFSDVAYTVILGNYFHESSRLLDCAKKATLLAVNLSKAGTPVNEISRAIENEARDNDFTIIKNLCSHGVGKSLHDHPANIINYYDPEETLLLEEGMVIAWEPYVSTGAVRAIERDDEWNLTTHNKSDVAQFEHTVLVTNDKPEILTVLKQ